MSYLLVQFGLFENVSGGRNIVWKQSLPEDDIPSGISLPEVFERFRGSIFLLLKSNFPRLKFDFLQWLSNFREIWENLLQQLSDFLQRLSDFREIQENLLQWLSDFYNGFLISKKSKKIFFNGFPIFSTAFCFLQRLSANKLFIFWIICSAN